MVLLIIDHLSTKVERPMILRTQKKGGVITKQIIIISIRIALGAGALQRADKDSSNATTNAQNSSHTKIIQLFSDYEIDQLKIGLLEVENNPRLVQVIIELAHRQPDYVQSKLYELVNLHKISSLQGLYNLLDQIRAALNQRTEEEAERGSIGFVYELYYALAAAKDDKVRTVQFGAIGGVGGDLVINFEESSMTVQVKYVTGTTSKSVKTRIREAMSQLGGSGGERPAAESTKVAEVVVANPENALMRLDEAGLEAQLVDYVTGSPTMNNADKVIVTLSRGDDRYTTMTFYIRAREYTLAHKK